MTLIQERDVGRYYWFWLGGGMSVPGETRSFDSFGGTFNESCQLAPSPAGCPLRSPCSLSKAALRASCSLGALLLAAPAAWLETSCRP